MVSVEEYIPTIDAILEVSDLEKISVKRLRRALQELFSVDFSADKQSINDLIMQRYTILVEDRKTNKKKRKSTKDLEKEDELTAARLHPSSNGKRKSPKKARSANPSSGLMRPLKLSDKLSEFLQTDNIARPEIVKRVWDYIKEHDLQNAEDRREILCDEKMKPVFGDKMTMFSMNKLLSNHIVGPSELPEGGTETSQDEKPKDAGNSLEIDVAQAPETDVEVEAKDKKPIKEVKEKKPKKEEE